MDSIFSALALGNLVKFLPGESNNARPDFDIIVYDSNSSDETLRLIGATERARWYLKYVRDLAEKTDIGRLTAPSLLKLAYESARLNSGSSNGKTSIEIWNDVESILEKTSASFTDSSKFGCYIVMDPSRTTSVHAAIRYWGCAVQAGSEISGALMFGPNSSIGIKEAVDEISPLPFALVPYIHIGSSVNWDASISSLGQDVKELFSVRKSLESSVRFDARQKTVTLFMPGFNKSEIKLYQYRGGTELLVEAGDQRRIIHLPSAMQGKVGGAKFTGRNLVVTLR